ncbi:MAG: DNA-directed RNA polymerase subunit omega [Bacteroidetes bacterium]|nr:DNA-directed RNA polymerase subunit omega [Bacteroidota bacterium]MBM3424990.1 DNA-directed RNA polymerase subunit omega [Bacteroidota bacterium]
MSYKNVNAEKTTITRDVVDLEIKTGNLYQSIVAVSKRSNQISTNLKEELVQKLQEFASTTDSLEEIYENREQIEISKHYERLPKATALAMQEMLEDKVYLRNPDPESDAV